MLKASLKAVCVAILTLLPPLFADDWNQWRGPTQNGANDANNLPASWSVEDGHNIAWIMKLDGEGNSTPVALNGMVCLTVTVGETRELRAVCVNAKDGQIAWSKNVGFGRTAARNNMASPSAVTDGKRIFFLFGQGLLTAFSVDGQPLWSRDLEKEYGGFTQKFGYSSSPLLHDGKLYIPMLHRSPSRKPASPGDIPDDSWLLAVNADTGQTVWKQKRPTLARGESQDSYSTPIITKHGLIMTGGDLVTCNNPRTGEELWRYEFVDDDSRRGDWRIVSSPVTDNNLIISAYPRGRQMFAFKPSRSGKPPEKIWEYTGHVPDVCSPALKDGLLYVLDGVKRYLSCIEVASGRLVWEEKMDSKAGFYASPTIADGKIYCLDRHGKIYVWAVGREPKLLKSFSIGKEDCCATITATGSSLYIRTPSRLICVRKAVGETL